MSRYPFPIYPALFAAVLLASACRTVSPQNHFRTGGTSGTNATSEATSEAKLRQRAKAHAHYGMGVVHEFSEETKDALNEFYLAAKTDPDDEELLVEVTGRLIEGRQYDRALELLESKALQDEASGVLAARLGLVYSQLGRITNAIAANLVALRKLPRSLQATQNIYVNYLQTRQPEAALKVLDDAAALPDATAEFLISLAELYSNYELQFTAQREALRTKQLDVLHRAAKLPPIAPPYLMKLGDGLNLLGDRDGAREAFLELVKLRDVPPAIMALARTKLADALLRSNDHTGAAEQLKAIVREDPSNATANFFLGQIALEQHQWADAADYLKKVLVFNPQLEQAYYDLARAQIGSGDHAGAIATLEIARGKYSSNFVIEFLTATTRAGMKDYVEAIRHYTRAEIVAGATNDRQLSSGFYFQFGAALERNGNRDEAARYFEKCLTLSPGDSEAMNYLGYMWAEQGINLERAKDLIERALKNEPDNEAFLDSMGWVLFKLNQPAPALEFLLRAVAKAEQPDATLYDHLGDIHAALQQMEKAREAWTKSLSIEKNDVVKSKLEGAAAPATK